VEFTTVAFWALTASTKSPWFPPSPSLLCFSLLVWCVGAARVWGVCNHGEHRRTPDTPVGHLKGEELPQDEAAVWKATWESLHRLRLQRGIRYGTFPLLCTY